MSYDYTSSEPSPGDISRVVKLSIARYWRAALPVALAILIIGALVTVVVPSYYTSTSVIFIQPPRVSAELVEEPNKDQMNERLEALIQEVLSRPRLQTIIEQLNLYPDLRGGKKKEKAIKKLKKSIEIVPVTSPTGVTLLQTFEISASYSDARTAKVIAQTVTDIFIQESALSRRSEIQGTEEFLDGQLLATRKKLEDTEEKIREFVSKNFGKLPEHLESAVARLQNAQSQFATNSELLQANLSRRSHLQDEIATVSKSPSALGTDIGDLQGSGDPQENLAQLEQALVLLKSKYSDKHPDVVGTKERIKSLKAAIASGTAGSRGGTPRISSAGSATLLRLKRELNEIEIQIQTLRDENDRLKKVISELESNIDAMPMKEQSLLGIRRDYENIKATYERLLAAREEATLQASLLRTQKTSSFKVVDPPQLPAEPSGPVRSLIALGAIILALAVFSGIILAGYLLNGSFKLRDEIESELRLKVIGTVPPLQTWKKRREDKSSLVAWSVFSAVLLVAGCAGVLLLV